MHTMKKIDIKNAFPVPKYPNPNSYRLTRVCLENLNNDNLMELEIEFHECRYCHYGYADDTPGAAICDDCNILVCGCEIDLVERVYKEELDRAYDNFLPEDPKDKFPENLCMNCASEYDR